MRNPTDILDHFAAFLAATGRADNSVAPFPGPLAPFLALAELIRLGGDEAAPAISFLSISLLNGRVTEDIEGGDRIAGTLIARRVAREFNAFRKSRGFTTDVT